jgi:HPt (histidine-containing phosphotransfer) domain-containing protein
MGDIDFLKTMMEELQRTIPGFVARIRQAMHSADLETLGKESHQFKGAAANLGAKDLAHAALKLEQIGKSGEIERAAEAFTQLEKSAAAFNQFLGRLDWSSISTR